MPPVVVVLSDPDPVARAVGERWGTPPSTGEFVDGAPVRSLGPGALVLRRPGPHLAEDDLDRRLPGSVREAGPTLVFPSIHRSEREIRCLTVHPLGNLGPDAELGGRARTVVPTDPARMAAVLRGLAEGAPALGVGATYEATHHGPALGLPAFFAEIGFGPDPSPDPAQVQLMADVLTAIEPDGGDRVALAVGGGHYAPHFTDLALRRRWAFGHVISRHALDVLDRETARAAFGATPGAEGVVYARAADVDRPALRDLAPRLPDGFAPVRGTAAGGPSP